MGNWTPDLFLTKEVLYPWATTAFVKTLTVDRCTLTEATNCHLSFFIWQLLSGRPGSNRPPIAWKAIALPNELLPQSWFENLEMCWFEIFTFRFLTQRSYFMKTINLQISKLTHLQIVSWAGEDSNLWSRKTADLQSAPFGRSGICPYIEPLVGIEPTTYWLQISCSTSWAKVASF